MWFFVRYEGKIDWREQGLSDNFDTISDRGHDIICISQFVRKPENDHEFITDCRIRNKGVKNHWLAEVR